jgi:hypothetical protein
LFYWVEVLDSVTSYLGDRLSEQDGRRVEENLTTLLAHHAEFYTADPSRRLAPESFTFYVDIIFTDSDGNLRAFNFIVSDEHASASVLRVLYCEEME